MALIVMLFDFSSCTMHVVSGTPYRVWHYSGHSRHHWGVSARTSPHHRFWGHHRYGPRPHSYRGHYR